MQLILLCFFGPWSRSFFDNELLTDVFGSLLAAYSVLVWKLNVFH